LPSMHMAITTSGTPAVHTRGSRLGMVWRGFHLHACLARLYMRARCVCVRVSLCGRGARTWHVQVVLAEGHHVG
jgi:hypothetical protein